MVETQQTQQSELILQTILMLGQRVASLDEKLTDVHQTIMAQQVQKEWYTTGELADASARANTPFRNGGATMAESNVKKTPNRENGGFPAHEYRRLVGGGALKPKRR